MSRPLLPTLGLALAILLGPIAGGPMQTALAPVAQVNAFGLADTDRASSHLPQVRLGIDRPVFGPGQVNFARAAANTKAWNVCLPNLCFDAPTSGTLSYATTNGNRAESYSNAQSIDFIANSIWDSILDAGLTLRDVLVDDVAETPFHQRNAWATVGVRYDLLRGCAEQDEVLAATSDVVWSLRGKLEAVALVAATGFAEVDVDVVPYTSHADPIVAAPTATPEFAAAAFASGAGIQEVPLNQVGRLVSPVNMRAGTGTTYLAVSSTAIALTAVAGYADALARAYQTGLIGSPGEGAFLEQVEVRWTDPSGPVPRTPAITGTAGLPSPEPGLAWYVGPIVNGAPQVTARFSASDAQTCVAWGEVVVDGASSGRVTVDPWNPGVGATIRGNGEHTVTQRWANHNGVVTERTSRIYLDGNAPSTTASVAGTLGGGGWYRSGVTVAFQCSDAGPSGCAGTSGTVDGAGFTGTSTSVAGDGAHDVRFASTDRAGNREATRVLKPAIRIDTTGPLTSAGPAQGTAGANGWFRSAVTFGLLCADTLGASLASGCAGTTHTIVTSTGSLGPRAGTSVLVAAEGLNTVTFASDDVAGNRGPTGTRTVRIDTQPPTSLVEVRPDGANGWYTRQPTLRATCDDGPSGSGCAGLAYRVDAGEWTFAEGAEAGIPVLGEGKHTVEVQAVDLAGWTEAEPRTVQVKVDLRDPTAELERPAPGRKYVADNEVPLGEVAGPTAAVGDLQVRVAGSDTAKGSGIWRIVVLVDGEEAERWTYPPSAAPRSIEEAWWWRLGACDVTRPPLNGLEGGHELGVEVTDVAGRAVSEHLDVARLDCTGTASADGPLGSGALAAGARDGGSSASVAEVRPYAEGVAAGPS